MPLKGSGETTAWVEIDRFGDETAGGVGWIAYPDEAMQRASHALVVDGDIWVVDPVDVAGLDDLLDEFGTVRGVVVLLDRHLRDAGVVANRHGVSVWVPQFFDGVDSDIDAPVERFRHDLADTGYAVHEVVNNRLWQEALLYNEESAVLVVPEAVGTTDYFRAASETLGVHPALRLKPPTTLARFDPDYLLVGHGAGIHEDAAKTLEDAVRGARGRTPGLYWKNLKQFLPG